MQEKKKEQKAESLFGLEKKDEGNMVKIQKKTIIALPCTREKKKKKKYYWQQRLELEKHFSGVVKQQRILFEQTEKIPYWEQEGIKFFLMDDLGEEIYTICLLWSSP